MLVALCPIVELIEHVAVLKFFYFEHQNMD
jgi:hypothetical protein